MTTRDPVHCLISGLPEDAQISARRSLKYPQSGYFDPRLRVSDTASEDDEPTTAEDERAVTEAGEHVRRGETLSPHEARRRFLP